MDHLGRLLIAQAEDPAPLEETLMHDVVQAHLAPPTVSSSIVYECPLAGGRTAFHKPVDGMTVHHPILGMPVFEWYGQADQWAVLNNEAAAWRLARALGAPWETMVASSVARWLRATGPGIVEGWGALTRKGEGPSGQMDPLNDEDLRDPAAFFDSLIGNQDRNMSNYRFANGVLTLFDHGLAFPGGRWRLNSSAFLQFRHAAGQSALSHEEQQLLSSLPTKSVWGEMRSILRADQFDALEWRREQMVSRVAVLRPIADDLAP